MNHKSLRLVWRWNYCTAARALLMLFSHQFPNKWQFTATLSLHMALYTITHKFCARNPLKWHRHSSISRWNGEGSMLAATRRNGKIQIIQAICFNFSFWRPFAIPSQERKKRSQHDEWYKFVSFAIELNSSFASTPSFFVETLTKQNVVYRTRKKRSENKWKQRERVRVSSWEREI